MKKSGLPYKLRSKKATTLIELAMLIVVVGVLVTSMSLFVKETVDLWNFVTFRSEIANQGRMALMRMVRDIRKANIISTANTSSLAFTDIDSDSVSYTMDGTNLKRGAEIVAGNVSSLTFGYYSVTNTQLTSVPLTSTDRSGTCRITVQMQIAYGGESLTLRSDAYLRNF